MHRITALPLWLLAGTALADASVDKYTGSIDSATLEAQVDVPLYTTPRGGPYPSVKVTIGDNEYLMGLATGTDVVYFGPAMVEKEEWKVKEGNAKLINIFGEANEFKPGGKMSWTQAPELHLGDLVLTEVVGLTKDPNENTNDFFKPHQAGDKIDGFIGLDALPSHIVWSIRPSTGTVSFAPAGEAGDALKAAIDGSTLSYRTTQSAIYEYGKRKSWRSHVGLIVQGNIGGQSVDISLQSLRLSGSLASGIEVGDALSEKSGDLEYRHLPVELGDLELGRGWFLHTSFYTHQQLDHTGMIGMHHLTDVDMVVDPSTMTVELARTTTQKRNDPVPFLLEQAKAAVAPEAEEEGDKEADVDKEADADKEDDTPPGTVAAWRRLAELQEATGDHDAAIASRKTATQFDVRECAQWKLLGQTQLGGGQIGDAIVSLETSSNAYHAWYDLSLEKRGEIEQQIKKLDKSEKKGFEHSVAQPSCHTADGWLAAALFSAGDMDTIEILYRDRLDLDPGLAMVTANARMVKGDYAGANEPLRQAVKLRKRPWSPASLGLALTYAKAGDWPTAEGHYRRAMHTSRSHRTIQMWLDGVRAAKGGEASVAAAQDFVKHHPDSAGAYFGLLDAAVAHGDAESIAAAKALAASFFEREVQRLPRNAQLQSVYARTLVLTEQYTEARKAAELALQLDPRQAAAWLAISDVERAAGNTARADAHRLRAAQVAPFNPGYALMMTR